MGLFILVAALLQEPASQTTLPQSVPSAPAPASAQAAATDQLINSAFRLVNEGKPAEAILIVEQVITAKERDHPPRGNVVIFSSRSMTEDLFYTALSAKLRKRVIVLDSNWADAYFLKGFALIDLKRGDEALPWLEKAVNLSPMNAHYLAEYAEWYKARGKWADALAAFERARSAATFSPDEVKVREEGRAIRGMAFVKIEQRKFDEAEKLLNDAIRLNPGDQRARADLAELPSFRR